MHCCKWCQSFDLVDTMDNVACRDCGADQGIPQFVIGYDNYDHVAEYEPFKAKPKYHMRMSMQQIQQQLNLPDSLMTSCEKLLQDYSTILGRNIQTSEVQDYILAAIYYTSRDTQYPISMKRLLSSLLTNPQGLFRVCSTLKGVMENTAGWKHLFHTNVDKTREITSCNNLIKCLGLKKDIEKIVRSKINKIYDRIQGNILISSVQPTTLAAAITFIAAKNAKIESVNMTKVSKYANITLASIISVSKVIMGLLVAK